MILRALRASDGAYAADIWMQLIYHWYMKIREIINFYLEQMRIFPSRSNNIDIIFINIQR